MLPEGPAFISRLTSDVGADADASGGRKDDMGFEREFLVVDEGLVPDDD